MRKIVLLSLVLLLVVAGCTQKDTGKINGHEWVDLGLSVKWATCNVEATSPEEYGDYYAWGETRTKSEYTEDNSVTCDKQMGSIAGDPQYDAARANWGGTWRLPTSDEIGDLIVECLWEWTTQGGHEGYKVTGLNGNSIFLPAAGYRHASSLDAAGDYGNYWSATPHPYEFLRDDAYELSFYGGGFGGYWDDRHCGQSVRPVSE